MKLKMRPYHKKFRFVIDRFGEIRIIRISHVRPGDTEADILDKPESEIEKELDGAKDTAGMKFRL